MNARIFVCVAVAFGAAIVARGAETAEIWSAQCQKCHGEDGKGKTPMGKKLKIVDLTDAKVMGAKTDEDLFKAIKEGRKSPSGNMLMKPAEDVTDADVQGLVKFVRNLKP